MLVGVWNEWFANVFLFYGFLNLTFVNSSV